MKMDRYLTPEAKTQILAEWEVIKQQYASSGITNSIGGRGYPDLPIYEWCDRLNQIPNLVTLQSCTGHRVSEDHVYSGNLWLWFSEGNSQLFNQYAFGLYAATYEQPNKERELVSDVRRFYQQYGQEVTSISFRGLEESTEVFRMSVLHICEFFERIFGGAN